MGEAFVQHSQRVFRVAYGITGSVSDSEDIVQDIFAALPDRLATFDGRSSLSTWLHSVAVRAALIRIRSDRLRDRMQPRFARLRALSEITRPVDRVALERALNSIPEHYRTVIWLKVVEGWTHAEIAGACGITENASYQRMHRARRMLRADLGDA